MQQRYAFLVLIVLSALCMSVSVAQTTSDQSDIFPGSPTSIAPGFTDYSNIDIHSTYTLQLVAMDNLDKAIAYAYKYNIDPRIAGVARTHTNGHLWYILAVGVYPSRAEAEIAKKQLEADGVPTPWIRTLASIEMLSREANELDM